MYENQLANVPTDLWIGGQWRKSSDGQRFDVVDPATENKITSVASASVDDAKTAVDAASDAFAGWATKKPRERAEILRKSFELILKETERLAKLMTLENGKALADSRAEVAYAAEFFRWFSEEAVRNLGSMSHTAANRFYVHEKVHEAFAKKLADRMTSLKMGNGLEEGVALGPLVNADTRD